MTCHDVEEKLSHHLLGEMSGVEGQTIEAHLHECEGCRGEAQRLRATIEMLREHAPASGAVLDVRRRAAIELEARRAPRSRVFPLAVAAAATVVFASLFWLSHPPPARFEEVPEPESQPYRFSVPVHPAPPAAPTSVPAPSEEAQTKAEQMAAVRALGYLRDDELAETTTSRATGNRVARDAVGDGGIAGGVAGGVEGGVPGGTVGGVLGGLPDSFSVRDASSLPNGAPAADMYFEHKGTNPFVQTDEDGLSTFGLDVDTASYTLARNYLLRGTRPPADAVRVEEFVNAFPHSYAPDRGKTFAIHVQGAPNPFHAGYQLLRIGLQARAVDGRERKPAVLVFVIDVSGSMAIENRLRLVKRSLELLVDKLDERDRIGIVVYGSSGRIVLLPTAVGEDRGRILSAIHGLEPEGSTNLEEGLNLGYEMARRAFRRGASNRIVLCTDGVANNGVTSAEGLLRQVEDQARSGIDLMALGFGMGNYNDVLLQKLADQGNGRYAYIDDFREARTFFLRDLTSVLEVVARDAKAQVQFDPEHVERYRLLGYEKRDVADRDFRNDAVDGGEVNSGHSVTVLYELKLKDGDGDAGLVRVRYAHPETGRVAEDAVPIHRSAFTHSLEDADPELRLDAVVARFAEHLRKSYWVKNESLSAVLREAHRLPADLRRTAPVAELIRLIHAAHREGESPR